MKCQILFSGKNKKNFINLPSAKNAQRVVKVKGQCKTVSRQYTEFTQNVKPYFLGKKKKKVLAAFSIDALRVNSSILCTNHKKSQCMENCFIL